MSPITDQNKVIGENIKTARKIKGLSQRALAEKLGIAFQNLSVWENGKGSPSAKYLMKLSEALNVSLDQLTSPNGIRANLEKSFPSEKKFTGFERGFTASNSQEFLEAEMPRIVQQGVAESPSLKLVVRYLEEILGLLKEGNK
jgi:transcriptional regulator with XRE-family HTH domain